MYFSVIQCALPTLPNLIYNNTEALPGSIINVTCGDGYIRKGAEILACSDDGIFNHDLPVCECK